MPLKIYFNSKYKTNLLHTGVDRVAEAYKKYLSERYSVSELRYSFNNKILKNIEEQVVLSRYKIAKNVIVIHPTNTAPIKKMNAYEILVIHDLAFLDYPQGFSELFRKWYKFLIPTILKSKDHIITVSNFTKRRIIEEYGINDKKISVVRNGIWLPQNRKDSYNRVFKHFLAVGTLNARKNYLTIIRAHKALPSDIRKKYPLRIVGGWEKNYRNENIKSLLDESIILEGYVSEERLSYLYQNALAQISASKYEGFGLPVLESISYNIIPIVSDIPAFREIIGTDYPFIFNTENEKELSRYMLIMAKNPLDIYNDPLIKNKFEEKLNLYNWETTLRPLNNIINKQIKPE